MVVWKKQLSCLSSAYAGSMTTFKYSQKSSTLKRLFSTGEPHFNSKYVYTRRTIYEFTGGKGFGWLYNIGYPFFLGFAGYIGWLWYRKGEIYWTWWIPVAAATLCLLCIPGSILFRQSKKSVQLMRLSHDKQTVNIRLGITTPGSEKTYLIKGSTLQTNKWSDDNFILNIMDEENQYHDLFVYLPEDSNDVNMQVENYPLVKTVLNGQVKDLLKYKYIDKSTSPK